MNGINNKQRKLDIVRDEITGKETTRLRLTAFNRLRIIFQKYGTVDLVGVCEAEKISMSICRQRVSLAHQALYGVKTSHGGVLQATFEKEREAGHVVHDEEEKKPEPKKEGKRRTWKQEHGTPW